MKKLLLLALLAGSIPALAFDVHFYKEGAGTQHQTIAGATKIVFAADMTTVTDSNGAETSVDNSTFAHMNFTATTAVSGVNVSGQPELIISGGWLTVNAETVESIDIYNISGNSVLRTEKSVCTLDGLARGMYIARVKADGKIIVKKFFKKF